MAEEIHASAQDKPEEVKLPGADLFDWLQMVMGCILAAVLLFNCFARLTQVDGESMTNTLQDGEMMLVWSLGYHPKAGDIVVVNKKTATFLDDRAIVKRVIAVGGQSVDIDYASGTVYVDRLPPGRALYQRDHVLPRQLYHEPDPLGRAPGPAVPHGRQPQRLHRQPGRALRAG